MKRKWIVEVIYILIGAVLVGISIADRKKSESEKPVSFEKPTITVMPDDVEKVSPQPTEEAGISIPPGPTEEAGVSIPPGPTGGAEVSPQPDVSEKEPAVTETPEPEKTTEEAGKMPGAIEIKNENYEKYENKKYGWWFSRKNNHIPSGSGEPFPIEPYSAYYLNTKAEEEDKVIYLTFDCGYENGFTPTILDTLADKGVKAMFFVTKSFIEKNPDYVKRMKEEGHLVGNHTVRHLSSPSLTPEELEAELREVAKTMEELTGYQIDPFFRPPMGEYSERTLAVSKDMGYTSVFWSIAYYDYDVKNQPGKDYVINHFATYHHNGAVALIHNVSESNTQALPEVIDLLRAEGYRFGMLTELTAEN